MTEMGTGRVESHPARLEFASLIQATLPIKGRDENVDARIKSGHGGERRLDEMPIIRGFRARGFLPFGNWLR
jgi:hypothetical protein